MACCESPWAVLNLGDLGLPEGQGTAVGSRQLAPDPVSLVERTLQVQVALYFVLRLHQLWSLTLSSRSKLGCSKLGNAKVIRQ